MKGYIWKSIFWA